MRPAIGEKSGVRPMLSGQTTQEATLLLALERVFGREKHAFRPRLCSAEKGRIMLAMDEST